MVGNNLRDELKESHQIIAPSSSELNLMKYDDVHAFLKEHQVDCVIHCAGRVGGIQANIKNPVDFLTENSIMGQNIVLASKNLGIKKLINFGSSCMYPKAAKNPIKEDALLTGSLEPTNEGYALAKLNVAKLCEYVNKENKDFHYKTLIPCNLYGYYDSFSPEKSHMIPAVIRKIYEAKKNNSPSVVIWGDGTAKREFLFTKELSKIVSFILRDLQSLPNYLNIGLGRDYTIKEYYQEIASVIGYHGLFEFDKSKPVGMKQKLVDISRLKQLGWNKESNLRDGLEETFKYFLKNEV